MGKKISQLNSITGGVFADADLFEISVSSGGAYLSRKITGAELKATMPSGITINTTPVSAGTSGRVLFENTGVVKESANFYWDDTNARLSIAQGSSPGARLDVRAAGALSTDLALRVRNSANTQNLVSISGNGNFIVGITGSYYISLDQASPALRGYSASSVAWQLSPWTGEHGWLTSNQTNQNLIGIGTVTPTDKLHINNTVNHSKIRIAMLASNPADESTGIRFTTTWCGGAYGGDAANIIARTKGSASTASQKTTLEFSLNAAGTTAIKASITSQSNFLLGNPTEDTADTGVIYVVSGTAPTASLTDGYKQYSADIVAGNAAPHFRTEAGDIIKLYKETTAVTSASISSPGGGTNVKTDDTFDGYTLAQVVKALRNLGILA